MSSSVYFADMRSRSDKETKQIKIQRLFDIAGFGEMIRKGDLTAIKVHFGEIGNDTFVSPYFARQVVRKVRDAGGRPFLTDTNTLYGGGRANSVDHINTAIEHGFAYSVVGAPLIIADGLRGDSHTSVTIRKKHFSSVTIAGDIARADSMIVLSHFKGHILSGFGGAIKNLGMGCAPAAGKAEQHKARPILYEDRCIGCGRCAEICPRSAITIRDGKSRFDLELCLGCGECLRFCQQHAIDFNWVVEIPPFVERMAEYALGAVKVKQDRTGFFNFLIDVTPDCDCIPWSDAPIVPDIGILASRDPVAIDHASLDLVNGQMGLEGTFLERNRAPGSDKFKGCWEHTMGYHQIEYGEEIGLGSSDYQLIKI